VAAEGETD